MNKVINIENVKHSVRHIKKGSMKNTYILGARKNRETKSYDSFTEFEQSKIISSLISNGFVNYSGENFVNDDGRWKYFNGGLSVYFRKG